MSMNTNAPQQDTSDEVNLIELWQILVKRRNIVIAMLVLSILVGGGYLTYTPAVYDSRVVFQVGQVGENYVEQPQLLVLRLKEKYQNDGMPRLTQINVEKGSANVVVVLAQDRTAADAQQYLNHIMHDLLAEHDRLYHQIADIQRQRLDSLGQRLVQLKTISQKLPPIDQAMKQGSSEMPREAVERGKLLVDVATTEDAYTKLHIVLGDSLSYTTRVLSGPTMAVAPSKPNATTLMIVALLLGAIMGIVVALFVEFLVKFRIQLRQQESA